MAKVKEKYRDIANRMMAHEKLLKIAQTEYERMSRLHYELPEGLKEWEWIRPVITTAPYDALRGAVRALANLEEAINVHPITVYGAVGSDDTEEARKMAGEWETTLRWELGKSFDRRKDLREDVVWSTAVYDICIGQIIHVPTHMKLTGAKANRLDAARMFGDWAVNLVDPKTVYIEWSKFMPERVLQVNVKTAREILEFWGDKAGEVLKEVESKGTKHVEQRMSEPWVEYDLVSHDEGRVVWAAQGPTPDFDRGGVLLLGPEPWLKDVKTGEQVPFLPWVISAGGTAVDYAPEHQLKPLLYPIYQAEQWATANIAGTIMMSQQIAAASSATDVVKGIGAEDVEEDWQGPRRRLNLTPFQEYQQLQDSGMDTGLREVFDRLEGAIQRATVAEVLVTAQPVSGEQAFASYNLQVQQALASLGGIRAVGQKFIKKIYTSMLLIAYYTGQDIEGYGEGLDKYIIKSEDIDPEKIQIVVELKADVPADRVQRVTSAQQLSSMQYPMRRILPMLGETDPEEALAEWQLEQMEMAYFQAKLELMQREFSGQINEEVMAAAQAMVEQMMSQQQQAGPQQGPPPQGPQAPMEEGVGPGGQPFNPAQGGIPTAMASPFGTAFEPRRGRPRGSDQPIAAVPGP